MNDCRESCVQCESDHMIIVSVERGGWSKGPRGGWKTATGERKTLPEGGAGEAGEKEGQKGFHLTFIFFFIRSFWNHHASLKPILQRTVCISSQTENSAVYLNPFISSPN